MTHSGTAIDIAIDRYIRIKMMINLAKDALLVQFDEQYPPATLQEKIRINKGSIIKYINREDYAKLYPRNGVPIPSSKMDMTLLVRVLRNIGLEAPYFGFDIEPLDAEISFAADVVRVNFLRNELSHSPVITLTEQQFENMSSTLIKVIQRWVCSKFNKDIENVLHGSLEHQADEIRWLAWKLKQRVICKINESLIQPAIARVIRLHEEQRIYYNFILGGMVLVNRMQIRKVRSSDDCFYHRGIFENLTVKRAFPTLYQNRLPKRNLAQVLFYEQNQNYPANVLLEGFRVDGNISFPEYKQSQRSFTFTSHSLFCLELPGFRLQCNHIEQPSTVCLWSGGKQTNFSITNINTREVHMTQHWVNYNIEKYATYKDYKDYNDYNRKLSHQIGLKTPEINFFISKKQIGISSHLQDESSCSKKRSNNDPSKPCLQSNPKQIVHGLRNLIDNPTTSYENFQNKYIARLCRNNVSHSAMKVNYNTTGMCEVSEKNEIKSEIFNRCFIMFIILCLVFIFCFVILIDRPRAYVVRRCKILVSPTVTRLRRFFPE